MSKLKKSAQNYPVIGIKQETYDVLYKYKKRTYTPLVKIFDDAVRCFVKTFPNPEDYVPLQDTNEEKE